MNLDKLSSSINSVKTTEINFEHVSKITEKYTSDNKPLITDAKNLEIYQRNALLLVMKTLGVYVWPTTELAEWIKKQYGNEERVIEIGAGNGVLSKNLNIIATDSFFQSSKYQAKSKKDQEFHRDSLKLYSITGQSLPSYGDNVEHLEAVDSIIKHAPHHVFGCFITHEDKEGNTGGFYLGVDEDWIINRDSIKSYAVVGNLKVHGHKPALKNPHKIIRLEGLVTRASEPDKNCIILWN